MAAQITVAGPGAYSEVVQIALGRLTVRAQYSRLRYYRWS